MFFPLRPFSFRTSIPSSIVFRPRLYQVVQRFAGHNKWSKIKHKKGVNDLKRGVVLSRFTREVMTAVKVSKSADPSLNPRLAALLVKARTLNIPKSNVETAIRKAQSPENQNVTEAIFEATAHGASFLLEVMTDNTNRVLGYIRMLFGRCGGGITNVNYMFQRKGVITCIAKDGDKLLEDAFNLGADDVDFLENDEHAVLTPFTSMYRIADDLKKLDYAILQVEPTYICDSGYLVKLPEEKRENFERLLEALDEIEDIVRIHHNAEEPHDRQSE